MGVCIYGIVLKDSFDSGSDFRRAYKRFMAMSSPFGLAFPNISCIAAPETTYEAFVSSRLAMELMPRATKGRALSRTPGSPGYR